MDRDLVAQIARAVSNNERLHRACRGVLLQKRLAAKNCNDALKNLRIRIHSGLLPFRSAISANAVP
jgi:hypothetical protein